MFLLMPTSVTITLISYDDYDPLIDIYITVNIKSIRYLEYDYFCPNINEY